MSIAEQITRDVHFVNSSRFPATVYFTHSALGRSYHTGP